MARMKLKAQSEFALFDVLYEDGTQTSNRKVLLQEISDLSDEQGIWDAITAQDAQIAERSGKVRGAIKSIERVKRKKAS